MIGALLIWKVSRRHKGRGDLISITTPTFKKNSAGSDIFLADLGKKQHQNGISLLDPQNYSLAFVPGGAGGRAPPPKYPLARR